MFFDFSSPNPEESKRKLENIRDIFQDAASKSTTEAQPLYQNLTDTFNNFLSDSLIDKKFNDINDAMKAVNPMLTGITKNMQNIQKLAMTDFSVAKEFAEVMTKFKNEVKARPSNQGRLNNKRPKPNTGNFKF